MLGLAGKPSHHVACRYLLKDSREPYERYEFGSSIIIYYYCDPEIA